MPLNIDVQQILLHMFNFVLLAVGLYLLLYKPVKNFMDNRTAEIEKQKREASELLQAAVEKEKAYSDLLKSAEEETRKKQEAADEKIRRNAELAHAAAQREAEMILSEAREKANETEKRTVADLKDSITDIAMMIASGILEHEISFKENEKIIRNSLADWSEKHD